MTVPTSVAVGALIGDLTVPEHSLAEEGYLLRRCLASRSTGFSEKSVPARTCPVCPLAAPNQAGYVAREEPKSSEVVP
jgi:hypothetical protein